MSNPAIGAYQFIMDQGSPPQDPAMQVEEITRAEVHGHAWREIGKRSDPVTLQTEADVSNPETTRAAYLALQGTYVTVTLPDGSTVANVMVRSVRPGQAQKMLKSSGGLTDGSGLWLLPCTWILQGCDV